MTVYQFDTQVACEYGLNEAIFLWNLQFWIRVNKANKINFHDGRTWSFNSVSSYEELFPFFTFKQIRCLIDRLVEAHILLKGNYNKLKMDQTSWLAFVNEEKWAPSLKGNIPKGSKKAASSLTPICPGGQMDKPSRANTDASQGQPIPDLENPDSKTNKKNVPSAIASGLAVDLLSAIRKTKEPDKEVKLENWAKEIDRMLSIDKISQERMKEVMDWLPTSAFWRMNIRSADKFREKFERLEFQMKDDREKQSKLQSQQEKASNRQANKDFVAKCVAKYPNAFKSLKWSGFMIINSENSKDVSIDLPEIKFQEVFLHIFGGKPRGN